MWHKASQSAFLKFTRDRSLHPPLKLGRDEQKIDNEAEGRASLSVRRARRVTPSAYILHTLLVRKAKKTDRIFVTEDDDEEESEEVVKDQGDPVEREEIIAPVLFQAGASPRSQRDIRGDRSPEE
ncbi:hypothetical protein FGB62_2g57 [Gracilaria domingensis]|nr:hypothetical protein FGB62_2g57 [Gracilaria domingensis]